MKPSLKQITPLIFEFEWEATISDELLQSQLNFRSNFQLDFKKEVFEIRMGFKTLAIVLSKPAGFSVINGWLKSQNPTKPLNSLPEKIWQIPVCYSSETGRDLETLAKAKGISQSDIIDLHSQVLYRIHFYGFLPGFMYLNGLKRELHTDRKSTPDRSVPVGSIAIGGTQTGIYPSASPGGWHLIGQTPISLFQPHLELPVFAAAGERIEFLPIAIKEFEQMKSHRKEPTFR